MIVERRCEVGDIADGINMNATIVLNKAGMLRLHEETDVVVVFFFAMTERKSHIMGVVLIFRETAERLVEIGIQLSIDR